MDSSELDNITLSQDLCSHLYENGVTNLDFSTIKKKQPLPFEGKNLQRILIAIDVPKQLKNEDRILLENLMKACQITMDDIALINMAEQECAISEIISHLEIQKAIFFGIPSLNIDLPIGNSEDSVIIYDNKTFIKTSPLSSLQNNVGKKKALWSALKNMFGV